MLENLKTDRACRLVRERGYDPQSLLRHRALNEGKLRLHERALLSRLQPHIRYKERHRCLDHPHQRVGRSREASLGRDSASDPIDPLQRQQAPASKLRGKRWLNKRLIEREFTRDLIYKRLDWIPHLSVAGNATETAESELRRVKKQVRYFMPGGEVRPDRAITPCIHERIVPMGAGCW